MWWSPDSRRIAYYRADEKQVPDSLTMHLDGVESLCDKLDTEAYPNSICRSDRRPVRIDIASGKTTKVDVGKPFDNSVVGHYVYHVA